MNKFKSLQLNNVDNVMNEINDNNWKLKLRIILRLVWICGLFSVTEVGWGQTGPDETPVLPPVANSVVGEAAVPSLNRLDSAPASAAPKPQDSLRLPVNQLPLDADGGSEKDPRLKGIFDRIKLLNKIIEEDKNVPETSEITPKPTPGELILGNPDQLKTTLPTKPAAEPEVTPNLQAHTEMPGGSQVLAEPMNSLELGNSLYMTANYPAAIRSYSMLLKQDMDNQEAAWLRLMLGCCYRYQDDYINAESIFRNVADRRGAGEFLMKHTTWNLQYLEERRKRQDEFLAVETELDALLLEINNEPTQK